MRAAWHSMAISDNFFLAGIAVHGGSESADAPATKIAIRTGAARISRRGVPILYVGAPLDCMLHRSRRGWGIEAGGHQKCGRRGAPWPPAARLRLGKLRARGGRAWRRRVTFRARAMGGPDAQCEQGFPAVTGKCSGQVSFTCLDIRIDIYALYPTRSTRGVCLLDSKFALCVETPHPVFL